MEVSKIQLSDAESEMMQNADLILTKNRVLQKMIGLLEQVQHRQQQFVETNALFDNEIFKTPAKISRGENYQGLPYVMLDYPRNFSKESTLAIRTFFWWGNSFSIHLQLSGEYHKKWASALNARYNYLRENEFFICVNADPWQHHFEEDNYMPVDKISADKFSMFSARLRAAIAAVARPFCFSRSRNHRRSLQPESIQRVSLLCI